MHHAAMRLLRRAESGDHDPQAGGDVPVRFDPQAVYQSVVDEVGDAEDADVLVRQQVVLTAVDAVGGARFLAEGMHALAAAVAQPYTLRTTADVPIIVEALQQQLDAAAGVSTGLGAWLRAAHGRGETGDPASVVAQLTDLAAQIQAVVAQISLESIPEDHSPGMDPATIAEQLSGHLQDRGVAVARTVISDSGIDWELPDDLVLSVNSEEWTLLAPTGRENTYQDLQAELPVQAYAHPAQVAEIVANWLAATD